MFLVQLFLGFPVDQLYSASLEKINPNIAAQFIQESEEYLRKATYKEISFLGKNIEKNATLSELEMLEKNIYSLLKKLIPDFPYKETSLYIFPFETKAAERSK